MENFFKIVEYFRTHAQAFAKDLRTDGANHKFLECDRGIGMRSAIDDIHHWDRQDLGIAATDVAEKWGAGV